MKYEKNKRLRDKLCQIKLQKQKKYNITDDNAQSSNYFLIANIQNSTNGDDDEEEDYQNKDIFQSEDLQNSQLGSQEQEMRNERLMDKSIIIKKTQSISPNLKDFGTRISNTNFIESQVETVEQVGSSYKGQVQKQYHTDFNSINILNSKLDTLRYTNIHMFTESIKTNNSHHPFESQFIVLEKTLGVVKRILQLMNTCLQQAQAILMNDTDSYRDLSQAQQQFHYFNTKMQEFMKQQEGRFFGSFKFNQQYKKNYTGGLNSLLKQFKLIFPENLSSAQKMFHSLIAHDVVVINFLDIEYVENELKEIKSRYDEEIHSFVMKFNDEQDFNLEISQNPKNNSWNPQSLIDVLQPLKDKEDKILNYAQKCLEFKLMDMIQESSKQIIEKAQHQCQQTTKNLFDLCSELYLTIFQILVKRKQIVDQIRIKKERESPTNTVSFVFDSKIYGDDKSKGHNLTIKLQPEIRKQSNAFSSSNKLAMDRKSVLKANENDSQAKKNIISVLNKAIKEKKKNQAEKSPLRMKSDKFFVINEEGNKEQGSSQQIQNTDSNQKSNQSAFKLEQKEDSQNKYKMLKEEQAIKSDLLKINSASSTHLDVQQDMQSPLVFNKRKSSILKQLEKNFNFQENLLLDIPRKSISFNSEQSLEKISLENFQFKEANKLNAADSDQQQMNQSQDKNQDSFLQKQSMITSQYDKKDKSNSDAKFRASYFYNNGQTNPFQISLYKDKTSQNRSEEEQRILISSLGYYKNKEKTINKVIQKKQIENGEVYDSFNSSFLTVDLKTKQNIISLTPKIKKINGFTKNQIIELQDDQNDVNLYKEAVYFEEERKNIKHIIQEETKFFSHFRPISKSIKDLSTPDKFRKNEERNRISSLNNSQHRQKNNSLNTSSIANTSKIMLINTQSSLSPSQLPSILKNLSPSSQSLQDSKVKVVKFPTVSNKKGVNFKDQPQIEKQASDENRKQSITTDTLNLSKISITKNENMKGSLSPFKIQESNRDNLIKQHLKQQEINQQPITSQHISQQQQTQPRGRSKQPYSDKISSNKERLYQQFNPETMQGEEFILEKYKKDFLHLDQVYKATIQANKEKLEMMKSKVNSDPQSEENINNDILKKYYEPKKRVDLQKLLSNTANKQFGQRQKSEEFNREESSNSLKEEVTNKESKTKIHQEWAQQEHLTNREGSSNKMKQKSKQKKSQTSKKHNKNLIENKIQIKKKSSKKKSNKQKQLKNQQAAEGEDNPHNYDPKNQNKIEDNSSDMNDSKLDIYDDLGSSSGCSNNSSKSNVSITYDRNNLQKEANNQQQFINS